MRCPDKVTALHSLTQHVASVHAPCCIRSRNALRFFAHHSSFCHAELVSASYREPLLFSVLGETLKFAIERAQSQACLSYAECEQIEQC